MEIDSSIIFDFETLSQDQIKGAVTCMAMLSFCEERFVKNPYTFLELVNNAKVIKFSVEEQVLKYQRKVDKSTLEWWDKQGEDAKKWIKPSDEDRSITELYDFFMNNRTVMHEKFYTRGNTFDPILLEQIMNDTGYQMRYYWWEIRDTRSLIEGLAWGSGLNNKYIPPNCEEVVKHDPRHDIALDVMRIQSLVQAIE